MDFSQVATGGIDAAMSVARRVSRSSLVLAIAVRSSALERDRPRLGAATMPQDAPRRRPRAAHHPPDQRRLLHRAGRRPGGLARVATLKQQIAAAGRTPLLHARRRLPVVVGRVDRLQGRADDRRAERRRPRPRHARQPRVRLRHRRPAPADGRGASGSGSSRTSSTPRPASQSAAPRRTSSARSARCKVGIHRPLPRRPKASPATSSTRIRLDRSARGGRDRYLPMLKTRRRDVIVALTHLTFAEDRALAERFPEIDLIVGGHEHFPITATENRTLISKAGSDAKFVARIDVDRRRDRRRRALLRADPGHRRASPDDPRDGGGRQRPTRRGWARELERGRRHDTRAARRRRRRGSAPAETNLGNLVADAMRAEARRRHRHRQLRRHPRRSRLPAGPADAPHAPRDPPVRQRRLQARGAGPDRAGGARTTASSRLPAAAGQFPQVSGMTMRVDPRAPPGSRVRDVRVNGAAARSATRPTRWRSPTSCCTAATATRCSRASACWSARKSGTLIAVALENVHRRQREVAPAVEGRIIDRAARRLRVELRCDSATQSRRAARVRRSRAASRPVRARTPSSTPTIDARSAAGRLTSAFTSHQ